MNSEIIAYRDKKLSNLQDDPFELHHYAANDDRTADDYAGREILELLQNAIDVGEKVRIELTDDILTVSNSGEPFKTNNIKALMIPDNSTKEDSEDTIGCKGVGFRASLNISDDIKIYSGKIHLRFSKETTEKIKAEYQLKDTPPMMMCPEETEETYHNDYTTNIVIKIRDEGQIERIKNQIEVLNKESIIFFNDEFKSLEVVIDGEENHFSRSREIVNDGEAIITIQHNETTYHLREFFEEGELEEFENKRDKKYRLAVVYAPEPIKHNKLYSFFRTDIDFPMQYWYAHGTFNLTNNRNQLVKNHRNGVLMMKLIQLICDSAPKISKKVDFTAYKILRSHGAFSDAILENLDLNEVLNRVILDAPILPTVHHKYISLNSEPVFYKQNFQKYLLNMPDNDDLLQHTNDETVASYLQEDDRLIYTYAYENITEYLQDILDDLNNQERIEVASLLYKYYRYENDFLELAPNFFRDEKGNEIENGSILIKTSVAEKLVLPKFIKLRYMNNEQLELVKKARGFTNNNDFALSSFAKAYGIELADTEKILDSIDERVQEKTKLVPEYVRWLFDNRETIRESGHVKFYLLTKDGEIRRSDNTYFGKEYLKGTPLEKFYGTSKIVADPATFKIKPDELEDFTAFLKNDLEVADYPRNKDGSIEGLKNILKVANTKYIIKLLITNQIYLNNHRTQSTAQNDFKTTKWITWQRRRYAPNEIVLTSKRNYRKISNYIKDDFLFISQEDLLSGINMEESKQIWLIKEYLCFNTKLYELSNKYIYKILNELPVFDLQGEICEDVYKDILDTNNVKPTEELPEFQKFIESGKVFCLDKAYHDIKDCLYLGETYPKIIEAEHNFINITKNKDGDTIWDRLHIEELLVNYMLYDFQKSKANCTEFQNDLDNFKISLLVEENDIFYNAERIDRLRDISIILCDEVNIKYDEKIGPLEDYEFVSEGDSFFVKVPSHKSFLELKNSDKFQDALSEVFRTNYHFLNADATARAIGRDMNSRTERAKDKHGNNAWTEAEAKLNLMSSQEQDYASENFKILTNLRDKYFTEYESRLYSKLQNSAIEEKARYVDHLIAYRDHDFNINDIPTQKDADMLAFLYNIYPILEENMIVVKDVHALRRKAYNALQKEFAENLEELDQLLDDNHFESLLRFNELNLIHDELVGLIRKDAEDEDPDGGNEISVDNIKVSNDDDELEITGNEEGISKVDDETEIPENNSNDDLDMLENNDERNIENTASKDNSGLNSTMTSKTGQNKSSAGQHQRRKTVNHYRGAKYVDFADIKAKNLGNGVDGSDHSTKRMSTTARKARERRAKQAEKIVLETLAKLGYSNIQWMSAYAKDEGINPNGTDGYGYDIQCEKNGEIRYIEVKSSLSATGVEFEMSENELNFCSQHAKNYDVAYVYAMNVNIPKVTIIENVFYKINNSNKTPTAYRIRLK